jgi:hypothetical protein
MQYIFSEGFHLPVPSTHLILLLSGGFHLPVLNTHLILLLSGGFHLPVPNTHLILLLSFYPLPLFIYPYHVLKPSSVIQKIYPYHVTSVVKVS